MAPSDNLYEFADLSDHFCVFNGKLVHEKDLALGREDAEGFTFGCFDTTRTFNGVPFRVKDHLERMMESAQYLMIKCPFSVEEMTEQMTMLLDANKDLIAKKDWWITTKLCPLGFHPEPWGKANVLMGMNPIPFAGRKEHVLKGLRCSMSSIRRPSADTYTPSCKANCNYPNLHYADMQVKSGDPSLVSLQMDSMGNVIEGPGANLFLVKNGMVLTPPVESVLGGISRKTVIELCDKLGIPLQERSMTLYDLYGAEEAFITSTSWCMCGVRSIDGRPVGASTEDNPFGPVTLRLREAYKQLTGCDFVAQYLHGDGRRCPLQPTNVPILAPAPTPAPTPAPVHSKL